MSGSFLFTRDSAGRLGGEANVQPLLRSVHNDSAPSLDAAVATAAQNKLVRVDGATVYLEPDVALMMIGRKSELREQLAPDDGSMTYRQIRSSDKNSDVFLYYMRYEPSMLQTDYIYVLAGPSYWNNTFAADLTKVNTKDMNGRSYSLDLGTNPAGNKPDPRMIIDHIKTLKN
jgi:hypothetical protein